MTTVSGQNSALDFLLKFQFILKSSFSTVYSGMYVYFESHKIFGKFLGKSIDVALFLLEGPFVLVNILFVDDVIIYIQYIHKLS